MAGRGPVSVANAIAVCRRDSANLRTMRAFRSSGQSISQLVVVPQLIFIRGDNNPDTGASFTPVKLNY